MAEDRIDSIIDRPAVQAEVDATKKEIADLVTLIKSVKGTALGITEAKTASEYATLRKELQKNIELTNQAVVATINHGTAIKQNTAARQQENLTLQQNIELRKRLQNSLNSYLTDQKEDLKLMRAGTITRDEYNRRITESTVRIEQYKNRIKEINGTIAQQTRTEKQLASERAKNAVIERTANEKQIAILQKSINQINKQSTAYAKLSKEYNEAALAAKNYNLTLGANDPLTVKATQRALQLSNQLKTVDAAVGQNQRSVGDYSNSITRAAGSAFGAIRKLAYVLPGLGIAGIFGLIFDGVTNLISPLFKVNKAFDEAKVSVKAYGDALREANTEAIKGSAADITKLELYRSILTDVTRSQSDRNEALKAYNSIADEANKIDASQLNNLTLINDKISTQITLVEKRALARAAEAILADKAEALLLAKEDARLQAQKDVENELIGIVAGSTQRQIELEEQLAVQRKINSNIKVKQAQAEFDASKKALYGLIQIEGFVSDQSGKNEKKRKEGLDGRLKALFEIAKLEQEQIAETAKIIFEDEQRLYLDRLIALQNYTNAKDKIVELTSNFEKEKTSLTVAEIQLIDKQAADARIKLARETAKILEDIQFSGRARKAEKASAEEFEIYDTLYDDLTDRIKKYEKEKERLTKEGADKEKQIAKDKAALQKSLISELTTLSFTLFTANIDRQKNALQEQLDALEIQKAREIELAGGNADAIAVIEARAQLQREAIQRKARELDIKKAQFDKAQAIARIIQETAIAVVSNLKNPTLIPLVIAIGAAQLATVLATPIPRYKEGGKHGGGPMIVGDGGRSEGIVFPDGSVMKSPATSTLMDAPAGTVIHKDFNKMLFNSTMTKPVEYKAAAVTDSNLKVVKGLKAVEKAIGKIPQTQITVQNPLKQRIRYGHSINEHLTRNLGK